jgi:hypothetical protein
VRTAISGARLLWMGTLLNQMLQGGTQLWGGVHGYGRCGTLPLPGNTKDILVKRIDRAWGVEKLLMPPNNTELNVTTKSQARQFTFVVIQSVNHTFKEDL